MPARMTEIAFWSRKEVTPANCWVYTGYRSRDGYGVLAFQGTQYRAHRLAWILTHSQPPEKHYVCHHCDNPGCFNPDHLFLGTQTENMRDMAEKHRGCDKLTHKEVKRIRQLLELGVTHAECGKIFDVSCTTITRIANDLVRSYRVL